LPPRSPAPARRLRPSADVGKHLEGTPLILHAVDLVIAEIETRDDSSDREEALTMLRELRQTLLDETS
jgi:hypothetical protein